MFCDFYDLPARCLSCQQQDISGTSRIYLKMENEMFDIMGAVTQTVSSSSPKFRLSKSNLFCTGQFLWSENVAHKNIPKIAIK